MAAVDLGAQSARVVLGRFDGERLFPAEVHRFSNVLVETRGRLQWDVLRLYGDLLEGLHAARWVDSVGIDSWAVDFGLLDRQGRLLQNPIRYRSARLLAARGAHVVVADLNLQDRGGSVVFVASKNALVAGANAAAYSSAKAASLHLARCLAEEGGPHGIRVNTVNPDAVIEGSSIWSSDWKAERASTYGIEEGDLPAFYRGRTRLGVNVFAEDVAEAIAFFAGPRTGESTGNVVNVDGGVTAAYPR